jgi:hypothetical protein
VLTTAVVELARAGGGVVELQAINKGRPKKGALANTPRRQHEPSSTDVRVRKNSKLTQKMLGGLGGKVQCCKWQD